MTKIACFSIKNFEKDVFEKKNAQFLYDIQYFEETLSLDTIEKAKGYDVVCILVTDFLCSKLIHILYEEKIRLLALRSNGFDHVDVKAAWGKIPVVHVPKYSPYSVAEHAVALMLSLSRNIIQASFRTKNSNFNLDGLIGFEMHGKTAGIIGAGHIGKVVVRILRGFGMRVLIYDTIADHSFGKSTGCSFVDLETLFKESDIISLHCPLTPNNQHMICHETIDKMKKNVILINTARGGLIKTSDLIHALHYGKIKAAGLDVYENESSYIFKDCSKSQIKDPMLQTLQKLPNVLLTPHEAFFTQEALEQIIETTLLNIEAWSKGEPMMNQISN